jgi:hypothetical protein
MLDFDIDLGEIEVTFDGAPGPESLDVDRLVRSLAIAVVRAQRQAVERCAIWHDKAAQAAHAEYLECLQRKDDIRAAFVLHEERLHKGCAEAFRAIVIESARSAGA